MLSDVKGRFLSTEPCRLSLRHSHLRPDAPVAPVTNYPKGPDDSRPRPSYPYPESCTMGFRENVREVTRLLAGCVRVGYSSPTSTRSLSVPPVTLLPVFPRLAE